MSHGNKTALITGAAQRIGAEITRELHRRGFTVIIHYRHTESPALALANQLNAIRTNSAHCLQADLTSLKEVKELAVNALQLSGRIDALVNNASSFYPTKMTDCTTEDWDALINSNLKGPFFLCQALAASLKDNQGCIVNIIDIHSERPMQEFPIYSIAKAGVAMMTKSLAKELAPDVRVNGVSPGAILWPEQEPDNERKTSLLEKIPMQRTGQSSDIALTVAFLIDDAPYISGQIIAVDGGRSLNM